MHIYVNICHVMTRVRKQFTIEVTNSRLWDELALFRYTRRTYNISFSVLVSAETSVGFLRIPIGISGRITAKDQNTSQPERYDTGYRCHEARSRESPNNYKHCIVLESEFGKELKMADSVRRLINWNRMVFYMEIFYFSCDKAEYPHA